MIELPNPNKYCEQYLSAVPFPHVVLDDFLTKELVAELNHEIATIPDEVWEQADHKAQTNKRWLSDFSKLPVKVQDVVQFFHTSPGLDWLRRLTRIEELVPDPELLGGGIHCTHEGGRLGIHTDFNWHPKLKLHRRLNVILFLNEDWSAADGGILELWHKAMTAPVHSYLPIAGRCVIFSTSEHSNHGHPVPVAKSKKRLSISLYFYAPTPPEGELLPPHWASWKRRPNENMF
jgi:Rps23 Pro-64 3,4-dihydroxylase Tpa1-like proline 4-hydroxylase